VANKSVVWPSLCARARNESCSICGGCFVKWFEYNSDFRRFAIEISGNMYFILTFPFIQIQLKNISVGRTHSSYCGYSLQVTPTLWAQNTSSTYRRFSVVLSQQNDNLEANMATVYRPDEKHCHHCAQTVSWQEHCPRGWGGRSVKLTTRVCLVLGAQTTALLHSEGRKMRC
jgi:hypothetical protein